MPLHVQHDMLGALWLVVVVVWWWTLAVACVRPRVRDENESGSGRGGVCNKVKQCKDLFFFLFFLWRTTQKS